MEASRGSPQVGMGAVYLMAKVEALRRGDRRVGTEHLILALLSDLAPEVPGALEVDLAAARQALDNLDMRALESVGLHLRPGKPVPPGSRKEQLKLTPGARSVFTGLRASSGGQRLGIRQVMLALLALQPPDPGAVLLDRLGVDRRTARSRLGAV